MPGALSKFHRAGSTDHQLVTRPLFALRVYSITARELSALNRGRCAAARSTSSRLGLPPFCHSSERKGVEDPADLAQDYLPALTTFPLCADEATWAATKRAIGTRKGEQET